MALKTERAACGNMGCSGEEQQQLHLCAREDTVYWRYKQNEERWWKVGKRWESGKMMVRKRRKLPKRRRIWCTNDAKVNILQGAKGKGRQGRKFFPSCSGDDMPQLVRQRVTNAPWSSCWSYLQLGTLWWLTITSPPTLSYKFKTSFQARGVIKQENHPGSILIRRISNLHKNSGHSTVLILWEFFSLQLYCNSHLSSPQNCNTFVQLVQDYQICFESCNYVPAWLSW